MRYRTRRSCSAGSMWMSDARSVIACVMSRLTKRTIGASSSATSPIRARSSSTCWATSCSNAEDRFSISPSTRQNRSIARMRSSCVATTVRTAIPQ